MYKRRIKRWGFEKNMTESRASRILNSGTVKDGVRKMMDKTRVAKYLKRKAVRRYEDARAPDHAPTEILLDDIGYPPPYSISTRTDSLGEVHSPSEVPGFGTIHDFEAISSPFGFAELDGFPVAVSNGAFAPAELPAGCSYLGKPSRKFRIHVAGS